MPLRRILSQALACSHTVLPDGKGGLRIGPAYIEWRGAYISQVETCSAERWREQLAVWQQLKPSLTVYEDKLVSPAFINAHTHLAMSFFRQLVTADSAAGNMVEDLFFTVERALSPEDIRAFARMGAYECLLAGVGLVWDHYYAGLAVADALLDVGLAGVVAPTLQDLAGPGAESWDREWEHTEEIASAERFSSHGVFAAFGPHATDTVSDELWRKIAASSRKLNLPLHAHLAQSAEEHQRVMARAHCPPLSLLERLGVLDEAAHSLLVHSIFVSRAELSHLPAGRATLGFCPFSALIFGFPAQILAWHAEGCRFIVATDCVASNDSMNIQKELRYIAGFPTQALSYSPAYERFLQGHSATLDELAAERQLAWSKFAALREPAGLLSRVWELPGRMHPRFQAGRLEAGALANLLIWDARHPSLWPAANLHSLAFGDSTGALFNMIVAGRKLGVDGRFASSLLESPAYRDAASEADGRLLALKKRCGL